MKHITNEEVIFYSKCSCGSINVETETGSYFCLEKDKKKYFPELDFRKLKAVKNEHTFYNCDYCVNHYGLDLCSCGSGEKVGECECGSTKPMQVVGEYSRCTADDAFLL